MKFIKPLRSIVALALIPCLLADVHLAAAVVSPSACLHSVQTSMSVYQSQALATQSAFSRRTTNPRAFTLRSMVGLWHRVGSWIESFDGVSTEELTARESQTEFASVVAQELRKRFRNSHGIALAVWFVLWSAILFYEGAQVLLASTWRLKKHIFLRVDVDGRWRWARFFYDAMTGYPFRSSRSHIGAWPVFPWFVRIVGHAMNFLIATPVLSRLLGEHVGAWILKEPGFWDGPAIVIVVIANGLFLGMEGFSRYLRRDPSRADRFHLFRRVVEWMALLINLGVSLPLIGHGLMHLDADLYVEPFFWQNHPFIAAWGVINLIFLISQIVVGIVLRRGAIHSLRYQYDLHHPTLLSGSEGRYRLNRLVKDYIRNDVTAQTPYVGIIRIDSAFDDILVNRVGPELANVMRDRIYSSLVKTVRARFKGALLSATEDENAILVTLPAGQGDPKAAVEKIIRELYERWLHGGYYIVDMPEMAEMKKRMPAQEFGRLQQLLSEEGICWSPERGGIALVLKTRKEDILPEDRIHVPIEDAQSEVTKSLYKVKHLVRFADRLGDVDLREGAAKYPPYDITLSAYFAGVQDSYELLAWQARESYLAEHPRIARSRALQMLSSVPKGDLDILVQANLERVLESMRAAFDDQLSLVAFQENPESASQIKVDTSFILPSRPESAEDPIVAREREIPLLDQSLEGQQPLSQEARALRQESEMEARIMADIRLKDHDVRLEKDIARDRLNWNAMRALHEKAMSEPARSERVYRSAWGPDQREIFARTIDDAIHPRGVRVEAIANPSAPPTMKTYGKADGNGMAVIGMMRDFFVNLVASENLDAGAARRGAYRLYEVLKSRMFAGYFGAGMATRAHEGTALGKFLGLLPMVRRPREEGERPQPMTLEEALRIHQSVIEQTFPRESGGRPAGGFILLYGDALVTLDPESLRTFFKKHPVIAEGFTLVLRKVPFEEATEWGCAVTDQAGRRILSFAEKPGNDALTDPKEREIIKLYVKDPAAAEALAKDYSKGEKTYDVQAIREKLRAYLSENHLLGEDDKTILMNSAIGVAGTGAMIRLMQLSGIAMDSGGQFIVPERGQAPVQPGDPDNILSRTQEDLAVFLDDKFDAVERIEQGVEKMLERLLADRSWTDGVDLAGNHAAAAETLKKAVIACQRAENLQEAKESVGNAIVELGSRMSVRDGFLRDGLEMDAMADIVKKMAALATAADEIFSKGIASIKKKLAAAQNGMKETPPDSEKYRAAQLAGEHLLKGLAYLAGLRQAEGLDDSFRRLAIDLPLGESRPAGRLERAEITQLAAALAKAMEKGPAKSFDPDQLDQTARRLEVAMARQRLLIREDEINRQAHLDVYQGLAAVRWHLLMWQILRAPGHGGFAYGFTAEGLWFDTGVSRNVLDYFLRLTRAGKMISAGFAFAVHLFSTAPAGHSVASAVQNIHAMPAENLTAIHPDSLRRGSYLGGTHPSNFDENGQRLHRPPRMNAGTGSHSASIPWVFDFRDEGILVVEGVVHGPPILLYEDGIGDFHQVSYVADSVYSANDLEPGKSDLHFGVPLDNHEVRVLKEGKPFTDTQLGWLAEQGVDASKVWKSNDDHVLFRARLFPGISTQLMSAASNEMSLRQLRNYAVDDLDWEIFVSMPQIWEWLLHKTHAPPPAKEGEPPTWFDVWLKAQEQGRLFAMIDHYVHRDPTAYIDRQKETKAHLDRENGKMSLPPAPEPRYWITQLDGKVASAYGTLWRHFEPASKAAAIGEGKLSNETISQAIGPVMAAGDYAGVRVQNGKLQDEKVVPVKSAELREAVQIALTYARQSDRGSIQYLEGTLFNAMGAESLTIASRMGFDVMEAGIKVGTVWGHGGRGPQHDDQVAYVYYPHLAQLMAIRRAIHQEFVAQTRRFQDRHLGLRPPPHVLRPPRLSDVRVGGMSIEEADALLFLYVRHEARHAWEKKNGITEWPAGDHDQESIYLRDQLRQLPIVKVDVRYSGFKGKSAERLPVTQIYHLVVPPGTTGRQAIAAVAGQVEHDYGFSSKTRFWIDEVRSPVMSLDEPLAPSEPGEALLYDLRREINGIGKTSYPIRLQFGQAVLAHSEGVRQHVDRTHGLLLEVDPDWTLSQVRREIEKLTNLPASSLVVLRDAGQINVDLAPHVQPMQGIARVANKASSLRFLYFPNTVEPNALESSRQVSDGRADLLPPAINSAGAQTVPVIVLLSGTVWQSDPALRQKADKNRRFLVHVPAATLFGHDLIQIIHDAIPAMASRSRLWIADHMGVPIGSMTEDPLVILANHIPEFELLYYENNTDPGSKSEPTRGGSPRSATSKLEGPLQFRGLWERLISALFPFMSFAEFLGSWSLGAVAVSAPAGIHFWTGSVSKAVDERRFA